MTPPATEAPFARRDSTLRFLALDRPYGGVVDWCGDLIHCVCVAEAAAPCSQVPVYRQGVLHRSVNSQVEGNAFEQSPLRKLS